MIKIVGQRYVSLEKKVSDSPKKIKYKASYKERDGKKIHNIAIVFYSPVPEESIKDLILDALSKKLKTDFGPR